MLVQPASAGDLGVEARSCRSGNRLAVPANGACAYRLRSGFLARRLRLKLRPPGSVEAELVQPKPKVTDTETLDAAHLTVDLTYRQSDSTLTLRCTADQGTTCELQIS